MRFTQSNLIAVFVLALLLLVCGCGNARLFNIAPRTEVTPPTLCCEARTPEFRIAAEPLTDEDKILATFDGNIILSGVLPVNVVIENNSISPVDLTHAQFVIVDGKGRQHKELDPKQALDKMVKYYGINYQRQGAYKATLEDLTKLSLTHKLSLGAGSNAHGFVYFDFDKDQPIPSGLKLLVKKYRSANGNQDLEIDFAGKR